MSDMSLDTLEGSDLRIFIAKSEIFHRYFHWIRYNLREDAEQIY